ncbi:MAG: carbamate kinase [Nocardioidaceae bacterium]|jgi:carbamate kinase|nr:carbamate kinase [Nocardioidaceae bacterium]
MRVLVALGGNALTGPGGSARADEQIAAAERAMKSVADLVVSGWDVVMTHGNGPQVGNLLVKNDLAAAVVPPVPLDWCVAQTQATLGFVLLDALEAALASQGVRRATAALVTRTVVDADDAAFTSPTKPIGRYVSRDEAADLIAHGQAFADFGARGWRRVVASPEPREILDAPAISALVQAGFIVVGNGGGGIPVVRDADGSVRGVEAVIDKDLGAALLARSVEVDRLVIATDVDNAVHGFGTPDARALGRVGVTEMRRYLTEGYFGSGSMGPKVEAVCRFVENAGRPGIITSLDNIVAGAAATAGTVVVPQDAP